ncbi:MAG TPA: helix-turn-helix domain-containing protein [Candidatus Limnocylindrales bacterium]
MRAGATRAVTGGGAEWITMREACGLLGVAPATLRRWADTGEVRTFTTPGGHRRFSRATLLQMLPAERVARPSLEHLGETPERMARVLRRGVDRADGEAAWVSTLPDEAREALREPGRRIAMALLAYLDAAPAEREAALRAGEEAARSYGTMARGAGATARQTIETFLGHRRPFVRELASTARRRALDAADTTELLESASEAVDRLLLATVEGFDEVEAARP